MKTERMRSIFMGATILGISMALSACSSTGSNSSVDTDPPIDPGSDTDVVERILAAGDVTFADDYVGKTFPFYFAIGEGSTTGAGIGSAQFLTATAIEVTIPGQEPVTYALTPDGRWLGPDNSTLTISDNGSFLAGEFFDEGGPNGGVMAYAGFETAVEDRPAVATTYDSDSFGVIFVTADGFDGVATQTCTDCVSLTADFANNSIEGQVFSGTADIEGDSFKVTNTLENGIIDEEGFSGNIKSEWEVSFAGVDGEPAQGTAAITEETVVGRFFGADGDDVAVVYEGDYTVDDGAGNSLSGTMSGGSNAGMADGES